MKRCSFNEQKFERYLSQRIPSPFGLLRSRLFRGPGFTAIQSSALKILLRYKNASDRQENYKAACVVNNLGMRRNVMMVSHRLYSGLYIVVLHACTRPFHSSISILRSSWSWRFLLGNGWASYIELFTPRDGQQTTRSARNRPDLLLQTGATRSITRAPLLTLPQWVQR